MSDHNHDEPGAFNVLIVYTDHEDKTCHIGALVLAVNERDAINGAVDAVRKLPQCKEVIGGVIERADDSDLDAALDSLKEALREDTKQAETPPIARASNVVPLRRKAGQTVH